MCRQISRVYARNQEVGKKQIDKKEQIYEGNKGKISPEPDKRNWASA